MYLQKIVDKKHEDPTFVQDSKVDWDRRLAENPRSTTSFTQSLRSRPEGQPGIIAEMKRASPSKGSFGFERRVSEQVKAYENGGARAISVLTNQPFFQGTLQDLEEARQAVSIPLLRKDFLTETWEIPQAKLHGADVILLIAAILEDGQMEKMISKAHHCGVEVLLEVHDGQELDRVLNLNSAPDAIGINNRNLRTFEVSLDTTERLVERLPKEICRVSESGFASRSDLKRFQGVVDAFLIGESLMRSEDPEQTLRGWVKG